MASRKGIAVTAAILVGVVAASFLVYLLPEDTTMKKLNDKITETIVIANLIGDNDTNSIDDILSKIKQLETESFDWAKKSDDSRP